MKVTFVILSVYLWGSIAHDDRTTGQYSVSRYNHNQEFRTAAACLRAIRRTGQRPAVVGAIENRILVCRRVMVER